MKVPGKVWKALGVAGVAGVAATGVVVARDQRRRRQVTPDQVRKRLHQRLADLEHDGDRPIVPADPPKAPVKRRGR